LCSKETHYFTGSLASWGLDAMWEIFCFLQWILTTETNFLMSHRISLYTKNNHFRDIPFCSWP